MRAFCYGARYIHNRFHSKILITTDGKPCKTDRISVVGFVVFRELKYRAPWGVPQGVRYLRGAA